MRWSIEWRPYQEKLRAIKKNKDEPVLYTDLNFIWNCFVELSSARVNLNPITFTEIKSYFDLYGINDLEQRQEITYLIKALDLEYLNIAQKKLEK